MTADFAVLFCRWANCADNHSRRLLTMIKDQQLDTTVPVPDETRYTIGEYRLFLNFVRKDVYDGVISITKEDVEKHPGMQFGAQSEESRRRSISNSFGW